jgi:hypothetical protein
MTAAALLLALAAQAGPRDVTLGDSLPAGVPSVAGWERVTGEADFADPDLSVHYELFVRPGRAGSYEVVRYRFAGPAAIDYALHERLQWDVNGHEVHRYECLPVERAKGAPARAPSWSWRELAIGSEPYRNEVRVILWLYELHRRLREARDAGELPG